MTPAEKIAKKKSKEKKPTRCTRKPQWVTSIRERRLSLRLTMRDVEKATGVTSASLCLIERGCDLNLTSARQLATFFGTSVEELWPRRL